MALASAEQLLKKQQQSTGDGSTEFNTSTNVPYAVVNLANDRQHLPAFPNIQEELHDGSIARPLSIAEELPGVHKHGDAPKTGGFFSHFRPHSAASSTTSRHGRRPKKPNGNVVDVCFVWILGYVLDVFFYFPIRLYPQYKL